MASALVERSMQLSVDRPDKALKLSRVTVWEPLTKLKFGAGQCIWNLDPVDTFSCFGIY